MRSRRKPSELYQVDFVAALFSGFLLIWLASASESDTSVRSAPTAVPVIVYGTYRWTAPRIPSRTCTNIEAFPTIQVSACGPARTLAGTHAPPGWASIDTCRSSTSIANQSSAETSCDLIPTSSALNGCIDAETFSALSLNSAAWLPCQLGSVSDDSSVATAGPFQSGILDTTFAVDFDIEGVISDDAPDMRTPRTIEVPVIGRLLRRLRSPSFQNADSSSSGHSLRETSETNLNLRSVALGLVPNSSFQPKTIRFNGDFSVQALVNDLSKPPESSNRSRPPLVIVRHLKESLLFPNPTFEIHFLVNPGPTERCYSASFEAKTTLIADVVPVATCTY